MTIGRIPSVEGGIQPTIVDAKGDLIAGVAADSVNRLAVGDNDQVLVADSGATTGLAWKSYGAQFVAGKNKIINGDFYWNQRNFTSVTTNNTYGFDRWKLDLSGGTVTMTPQTFTPGSAPVAGYEGVNFLRVATTGQTLQSQYAYVEQKIEDVRTLAGQTATLSFWAKAGSGTPYLWAEYYQDFGSGGSPTVGAQIGSTFTLSTSWTRYTATVSIPSVSGKTIGSGSHLRINLFTSAGSSVRGSYANATFQNATIDIWGVQLEAGSVATPFTTATGTIQGELAACQRYYWRSVGKNDGYFGFGSANATTQAIIQVKIPVTMRTNPASVDSSSLYVADGVNAFTGGTVTLSSGSTRDLAVINYATTGLTQYRPYYLSMTSDNGYIGFSAEL